MGYLKLFDIHYCRIPVSKLNMLARRKYFFLLRIFGFGQEKASGFVIVRVQY